MFILEPLRRRFSEQAIAKGKERYPQLQLWCEDGYKTHFHDSIFHVLISYGSYEHFYDPQKALIEASRILRPDGLFFIMLPTLGIQRTDREDEGWYEELKVEDLPRPLQLQWNLRRETWANYFSEAGLTLKEVNSSSQFGALKPGVFYFGEK